MPLHFFPGEDIAEEEPEQPLVAQLEDHVLAVGQPLVQHTLALRRQRVDGPLARAAGLLARLQVAQLGQPLRLDVVLALARAVEDAAALGHPQQVVRAGAGAADEAEDLVREEAELGS